MKKRQAKIRIASVLFFIVVLLYAQDKSNIKTIVALIGLSLLLSVPLILVLHKYKEKLRKIPKEVNALLAVASLFFWQWIHSASHDVAIILSFILSFTIISIAFLFDEENKATSGS